MRHSLTSGSTTGSADSGEDGESTAGDVGGAPELERSRFSRWLASFGLGEATDPLLRPQKSPRQRGGH